MSATRGEIRFLSAGDAEELLKALTTEGYLVELRPVPEDAGAPWRVDVEPFDDDVVAMVDVYGGWLPDDV
jgi:hypothetical protein